MLEVQESRVGLDPEAAFFYDILNIYSPSEQERPVAEHIVAHMHKLGYRRAYIDEAGNAVGEIGATEAEATQTIVLLGHIDTVPGFIPVRIEADGDTIYGRGAADAKGPFGAFVLGAARLIGQVEGLKNKRVVVVGAVEEEAPTSKGARYAQHQYRPDFCVIGEPSGWDRVTIAYKGTLQLKFRLAHDLKHTAADGPSVSEEGIEFWNKLRGYAASFSQDKKITETLQANLREINSRSDGFTEEITLRVGLRIPLGFDLPGFKAQLREWAGEAQLDFLGEELPIRADKNSRLVRAFNTAIREEGGQPAPKSKTGTSDMNVLGPVWGCPIVAYGPGDSSLDHTPNEHASLSEFRRGVNVIARLLTLL